MTQTITIDTRNWAFLLPEAETCEHAEALLAATLGLFESKFGMVVMTAEPCVVFNAPGSACPQTLESWNMINIPNTIAIRLSLPSDWYQYPERYPQFVYQFSHELTHYAIRQICPSSIEEVRINWFEETLCEAMALFCLRWFIAIKGNVDTTFFNPYLRLAYSETPKDGLACCRTMSDLRALDKQCQNQREHRIRERNQLFDAFCQQPDDIAEVVHYTEYELNELLVDFDRWKAVVPDNALIPVLESIQPKIAVE